MSTQKLKPTIDAIKRLYGDDKNKIQRETSELYKKSGVSPTAGAQTGSLTCLTLFWAPQGRRAAALRVEADAGAAMQEKGCRVAGAWLQEGVLCWVNDRGSYCSSARKGPFARSDTVKISLLLLISIKGFAYSGKHRMLWCLMTCT